MKGCVYHLYVEKTSFLGRFSLEIAQTVAFFRSPAHLRAKLGHPRHVFTGSLWPFSFSS